MTLRNLAGRVWDVGREKVERACLRCGKQFDSSGPGNRLCQRCRSVDVSPLAP